MEWVKTSQVKMKITYIYILSPFSELWLYRLKAQKQQEDVREFVIDVVN